MIMLCVSHFIVITIMKIYEYLPIMNLLSEVNVLIINVLKFNNKTD